MGTFSLRHRGKLLCFLFLIAATAFTADVVDLREELRYLDYPYSFLDSNISTGTASPAGFDAEPPPVGASVLWKACFPVSFLHLLPYGLRAPPSRA